MNDLRQSSHLEFTPKQQLQNLWEKLQMNATEEEQSKTSKNHLEQKPKWIKKFSSSLSTSSSSCPFKRKWPTYKEIMDDITQSDYNHVLECPHDLIPKSKKSKTSMEKGKAFCPHGVVCQAKLEIFENHSNDPSYTGLLSPGNTIENCVIRLSSAMKPPAAENNKFGQFFLKATGGKLKHAKLFPMVALKCFRDNQRSGNLLFAGRKIGQSSNEFFQHCLCTQMTERVPTLLKPFISKFYSYSENPLSLGISDFCKFDEDGNETSDVTFPYVVMLMPVYKCCTSNCKHGDCKCEYETFDQFIDDLMHIPSNAVLFDIFACPTPSSALDGTKIQRIGRITSTSKVILSSPNDGLFFRHQKKEEDFELRPKWRDEVKMTCSPDGGNTVGTIDRLVGSTILEGLIREKKYKDFGHVE